MAKATKTDTGAGVELLQDVDPSAPAHQQPYPTGTPQDPEGREVFKQAHGYYPDEPPIGTPPGQAEEVAPEAARSKKTADEPVKKGR